MISWDICIWYRIVHLYLVIVRFGNNLLMCPMVLSMDTHVFESSKDLEHSPFNSRLMENLRDELFQTSILSSLNKWTPQRLLHSLALWITLADLACCQFFGTDANPKLLIVKETDQGFEKLILLTESHYFVGGFMLFVGIKMIDGKFMAFHVFSVQRPATNYQPMYEYFKSVESDYVSLESSWSPWTSMTMEFHNLE